MRRLAPVAILALSGLLTLACSGSPTAATLTPSPLIVPDAVTVGLGAAQVFVVQNATVIRFELRGDHQDWSECVTVDPAFAQPNSIRVIARSRCRGAVFVSATIGEQHSPLVAVLAVQ
jgi:hypothetical protein